MLLKKSQLKPDQTKAIDFMYEHDRGLLCSAMGFGKTVVALSAIQELLDDKVINKVLVITTKKIAQTVWKQECMKWEHLKDLDVAVALGTEQQRLNALESDADIVVTTFDNLVWLCRKQSHLMPRFDGLLIDETSKLKTSGGEGFKALRKYTDKMKWSFGMSGTPVSEDFQGLYAQMLIVCGSESPLGSRKDKYLARYFVGDYNNYNYELREGAYKLILNKIADFVHLSDDYTHTLPPIEYRKLTLSMPDGVREGYKELAKTFVLDDIEAENSAVLQGKLAQLSCGFLYGADGERIEIDDFRLQRFKRFVASTDEPLLVFYYWNSDLEPLMNIVESLGLNGASLGGKTSDKQLPITVDDWNDGKIDVLFLHPRSAAHGLNLSKGGCKALWYSPIFSNDAHSQANARIWRTGQTKPVTIYELVVLDSVDEITVQRLADKKRFMELFEKHIKTAS